MSFGNNATQIYASTKTTGLVESRLDLALAEMNAKIIPNLPFASLTDPVLNAITENMVSNYGGVTITLTGAGNSQTLPAPSNPALFYHFTIINNDTSTNDINIVGSSTVTVQPGKAIQEVWDGTAWITIDEEGFWYDDGDSLKAQNSSRNFNLQFGIIKDNDATAGISFADASNSTLNAGLGSASVIGGINDNTQSQIDEENTGFISWGGAGDYYSITVETPPTEDTFTLLRPGTGRIRGKLISWLGGQTISLVSNKTSFIYIDSTGTIGQVTHDVVVDNDYYNYIMLMEVFYNGTVENVVDESHPYTENSRLSRFLHNNVGTVIRGAGAIITRVATGTGASADDRRIKTVGDDYLDDHGLITGLTATNPISFSNVYTDASGNWTVYSKSSENPMYYNNSGTPTIIPDGKYVNFRIYASKNEPNAGTPTYFRVMGSTIYNNLALANVAITNNTVPIQTNELKAIELAQLGFETVVQNLSGGYISQLIVSKAKLGFVQVGGGTTLEHDILSGLKLANTSVTYGHINDQAQSIYGDKSFYGETVFNAGALDKNFTIKKLTSGNAFEYDAGETTLKLSAFTQFQDPGTNANSYKLGFISDNATVPQYSSLQGIYGPVPYLRLSVPHETGGGETALVDFSRTRIAMANDGVVDLGVTGAGRLKDIYISGSFKSEITTGTAPLIVASTTVVSNLNADLLDGNHASAFEPAFSKNTAFNKDFGTTTSTVADGKVLNDLGIIVSALETSYSRRTTVISIVDNTVAPPTEVLNDRYILDFTVGGVNADWDGASAGDIVQFNGTTWDALTPLEGYVAYSDADNKDSLFIDDGVPAWELREVAVANHNDTQNKQGGTSNEYYHLTSAEHTIAIQAASTTLSGYLTTTDWNTFNNKATDSTVVKLTGRAGGQTIDGGTLTTQTLGLRNNAIDNLGVTINADGSLSVNATNYETLVTGDDDIPNKKYVDDSVAATNELSEVLAIGNTTGGTDIIISSGDAISSAVAGDMKFILGDNIGANIIDIKNLAGTTIATINSLGDSEFGIGQDSVDEVKNALGTTIIKWSSKGHSFVNGFNTGFGTIVPIAKVDIAGSEAKKVRTIAAANGTIAITDNVIAVDYTTTGTVALDLPSAATAWNATDNTGIVFTIMDIDANANTNNITLKRNGADTIIDTAAGQTSTVINADGGVLRIMAISATVWKVF